jgi:hypothetical protein
VNAFEFNQSMGGFYGSASWMDNCREAINGEMRLGDRIIAKHGSALSLTIRYVLPRPAHQTTSPHARAFAFQGGCSIWHSNITSKQNQPRLPEAELLCGARCTSDRAATVFYTVTVVAAVKPALKASP